MMLTYFTYSKNIFHFITTEFLLFIQMFPSSHTAADSGSLIITTAAATTHSIHNEPEVCSHTHLIYSAASTYCHLTPPL